MKRTLPVPFAAALVLATAPDALAQQGGGDEQGAGQGQAPIRVEIPAQPAPQVIVPGYPQPGTDINKHLPSSSRALDDISKGDTFDLNKPSASDIVVRGGSNNVHVGEGSFVPELHTVRRGDTLWEITQRYYTNPYLWPRLWALNGQIQNPHWIYPGDRVRLREPGAPGGRSSLLKPRKGLAPKSVVLRDYGWLDDPKKDKWGSIVGAPEDHMFLNPGDALYIQIEGDHQVQVGQELSVFRTVKSIKPDKVKGEIVSIRGTVKVDRYNKDTKMVRAVVTEALDVIERGAMVGPIDRKFDVVPPKTSDVDLDAAIVGMLYPHAFVAANRVVIIDKGEKDGVKPGHRFFAVKRGDDWRQTLKGAGEQLLYQPQTEDDADAAEAKVAKGGDEKKFPDETYAELRILRTREHTATALIVESKHEVERNAKLYCRKGF